MKRDSRQSGFTLIEIAAVLVLMALLASVAAVSAAGMTGGATQQEFVAQIASLDEEARVYAKQSAQPTALNIDTSQRKLSLLATEASGESVLASMMLPRGYTVLEAWVWRRDQQRVQQDLSLQYDRSGITESWGINLKPPGDQPPLRLLILGSSGQILQLDHNEQAKDILSPDRRRDAD